MAEVVVDDVAATGSQVTCSVTPSGALRRFFTGRDLSVEYDRSVADVPEAIAAIPALAQVCPVAWANGADVRVPALDRPFAASLDEVRDVLLATYPEFMTGGAVRPDRLVSPDRPADESAPDDPRSALLFSGGVDSTATYVRHREEAPMLISIQGWVVDTEDGTGWNRTVERLGAFATERGIEHVPVRSNMLQVLDTPMLQATYQRYLEGAWYSSVGHGLGLLGLCAPLAFACGIDRLYIAATHWTGTDIRWGSSPAIDDRVRWTGTTAHHDGYELTRQERIERIAAYIRDGNPDLTLRTCNEETAGNCGRCEKCARTIVGLLLAGLDPTDHGYPVADDLFAHVRDRFEAGDWVLSRDELLMWRDLRGHVPASPSAVEPPESVDDQALARFFAWLAQADLAGLVDRSGRPFRHRFLQAVARHTPTPVYERLYPIYQAVR